MATGSHLKIVPMGTKVLGVRLTGNPAKPEPIHFRVMFPGGDVDIVRNGKGDNWIHVRVDKEGYGMFMPGEDIPASIVDARLDCMNESTSNLSVGDFNRPDLYHLAVRIKTEREGNHEQKT